MRATVVGLAARRSISRPRCPDLLVPRHVRIDHVLPLSRAPHTDERSDCFARDRVHHDGRPSDPRSPRARPARWCGTDVLPRTAPRRERANAREKNCFAAPKIVQHGGDAVGPLLESRQRVRRDGIGCSRARLVEENQPTERCHRLDPPLKGRQLREELTACEPVRHEHDVAGSRRRRPIGDAQVTVAGIARLGEHGGSVSCRAARFRRSAGVPVAWAGCRRR